MCHTLTPHVRIDADVWKYYLFKQHPDYHESPVPLLHTLLSGASCACCCCPAVLLFGCCDVKSYALQSKLVTALNTKVADKAAERFPVAAYALQAASALLPSNAATATVRRLLSDSDDPNNQPWVPSRDAPTNVLLLPAGSAVGAVADIMSVEAVNTPSEPAIVLTLDIVHKPEVTSELQSHPTQTLDDHAHYHFYAPAGVSIDADRFLDMVKSSAHSFSGVASVG